MTRFSLFAIVFDYHHPYYEFYFHLAQLDILKFTLSHILTIRKIHTLSKLAVTFEPLMGL